MPASLLLPSRYQQQDASQSWLLPAILLLSSTLCNIGTPVAHSLLTSAIAWLALYVYTSLRLRRGKGRGAQEDGGAVAQASRTSWAAGGLLALAKICERAVDGRGIWWANGLLPVALSVLLSTPLFSPSPESSTPPASPDKSRSHPSAISSTSGSRMTLAVLSACAVTAIFAASGSNATIALGLSYTVLTTIAFLLVQHARSEARHGNGSGTVIYSVNGLLSRPSASGTRSGETKMAVMRDVAAAAGLATALAAISLESLTFGGLGYWGVFGRLLGDNWVFWDGILGVVYALVMIGMHIGVYGCLILLIQSQGPFLTSFVHLSAAIVSQTVVDFSISRVWFAALCAASSYTFLEEQETFSSGPRKRLRVSKMLTLLAAISFAVLAALSLRQPYEAYKFRHPSAGNQDGGGIEMKPPPTTFAPVQFTNSRVHPIDQLVRDAEVEWMNVVQGQSQTLEQAVTEYRRRYKIPPPPNFDKWYEMAKKRGVQMIDEYDSIYRTLRPFWALTPATIRGRAREAIGNTDNFLMGLLIRDGRAQYVENGPDWLQQAAVGMIEHFVKYLPDMDLAFNTHDESRVVVPHDDLTRLVQEATDKAMPAAFANPHPRNSFSFRPNDLTSGSRIPEAKTTRFNVYAHQPVWIPSRLSCPPDSPARALDEALAGDNLTSYALSDLGFVYNATAFSDICNSPSLASSHGFFERPNAFNLVHDLFPIFSQSKMSSFQDILYPSPWYWYDKVPYVERQDIDWKAKMDAILWRGSTTGGFSRNGGWRHQHRQLMVKKLNALDSAKILENVKKDPGIDEATPDWRLKSVSRGEYKDVMDVHFSHIGQCDPGDCDAQKEFFGITEGVDQQNHWKWKFLLDMDGNAFSGRFYAFLKSRSLVFKMAVFREWHMDWLRPWVHFIPLSLRGDDALEAVRYFSGEPDGKRDAIRLAEQGRDWAAKALRNEDFEIWLFRLLLEYGRLVDDDREVIGYAGS